MNSPPRNRGGWSNASTDKLNVVCRVLDDLKDYWPLTLRQVYYQLVAKGIIPNKRNEYQKLSRLLTKGRLDGGVLWEAIEDRARQILQSGGWADAAHFIESEKEHFLRGYRRDLLADQPWAIEVWVEKDALSRICHDVAFRFCVPVIVARGFVSVSYIHACRQRAEAAVAEGKRGLRILYFGDLDPSGWNMLPAMLHTLQVEMGLGDTVDGIRCALTPEQVSAYELPRSIDAMKASDTRTPRYREWLREEGQPDDLAVELDALPPHQLQQIVKFSIERQIDIDLLERQRRREKEDRDRIAGLRQQAVRSLSGGLEGDR